MLGGSTMRQAKQSSKAKKRVTKVAVPAFGAAGLTFSLAGSAMASAVPTPDVTTIAELRIKSGHHLRRRGNGRRQPRHVPPVRQGRRSWPRAGGLPWMRRLSRMRRLSGMPGLPMWRRLPRLRRWCGGMRRRRMRRLLRIVGPLPLVLVPRRVPNGVSRIRSIIGRPRERVRPIAWFRYCACAGDPR